MQEIRTSLIGLGVTFGVRIECWICTSPGSSSEPQQHGSRAPLLPSPFWRLLGNSSYLWRMSGGYINTPAPEWQP
ncbi:MAG: hypothetical protein JWQ55_233 [Rhodopila sp.]|nr:hypothetical protein [Rhodopila sp.]